jgi:Ca2+-binding RTX toxin-like protein
MATRQQVATLYIAFFDRAPEKTGLDFWFNTGSSLEQLAATWMDGGYPEVNAKFPAGMDTTAFVTSVYTNVFGRAPDAGGLKFWADAVNNGISHPNIIVEMIKAAGDANNTDSDRLENMTNVALYWSEKNVDNAPNAFEVLDPVTADVDTVTECQQWIDGGTKPVDPTTPVDPPAPTNQTFNLNDSKVDYAANVQGGAGNDMYNVVDFKTASINGGEGVDYANGVTVDLRAGTGPDGMKVSWVENVIGTEGDDVITGSRDANVITMMGGADTIDAYLGDDLIIAADMDNVINSTINGASGNDTLKILAADIDLDAVALATTSVEIVKVGYDGVEEVAAAATVTVDGTLFDPAAEGIKEIHANTTKVYDRKGVEIFDEVVSSTADLDLTGVALYNFERVAVSAANGIITVGANTLTQLKEVVGVATAGVATTTLDLVGKDGDVFDMSAPKLINISILDAPVATAADQDTNIKATMIMAQKQLSDLALVGDFSKVTLQLKGQSVDMTGVDLTGLADGLDTDTSGTFKEIVFGANDTKSLLLSDEGIAILAAGGTTIIGSEFEEDSLSIRAATDIDMTGLITTSIESMDFEGATTITLDNMVLHGPEGVNTPKGDVHNIAGDSALATAIFNGNALDADGPDNIAGNADDAAVVALDLGGVKLRDIAALGDSTGSDQNVFSIDTGTILSTVKEAYGEIKLAEAGTYDLSSIKETNDGTLDLLITGSKGDDVVKGTTGGASYNMGAGNDTVNGGDADDNIDGSTGNDTLNGGKGSDILEGGAGNDNLNGGDGADTLHGNSGVDSLTGGLGEDNFDFTTGDSGMTAETVDCINDFTFTGKVDNDDLINFTFLTDSSIVTDGEGTGFAAANVGADFADEATLADAALAALESLYTDAVDAVDADVAVDAGDYLAVLFQSGGNQYMAVDAYVSAAANVDFIVKLAGVTDATADLMVKNIDSVLTVTYDQAAIA